MPIQESQLVSKQHAVPQNIMDVEFKLIGDLTMRQFAYLLFGGGVAYLCFSVLQGLLKWPFVIFFALLGLGLAFFTYGDRGLDQWIVSFIKAMYLPTQKIWYKDPNVPSVFLYQNLAVVRQELITLAPTTSRRKLEAYLEQQTDRTKEDRLDIPEMEYIKKVRDAYSYVVAPAVDVIVEEPLVMPEIIKPEQPTSASESVKQPVVKLPKIPPIMPRKQQEVKKPESFDVTLVPITPDRHSGRKFTSLLPNKAGEIILPIRGEKVLQTSEELNIEADISDKTEQLQKLIKQIKSNEDYKAPAASVRQAATDVTGKLRAENESLTKQIEDLKKEVALTKSAEKIGQLHKLEQERARTTNGYSSISETLGQLDEKTLEQARAKPAVYTIAETTVINRNVPPSYASVSPLTNKPNSISGIVKASSGTSVDGVVVIVKNSKGEPVRALKTNSLGQFAISTPVTNGKYTIEIDKSDKTGLTFDIISLELNGTVIPPLEFVGK